MSWNIRGAFSSNTMLYGRDLIKIHNPYVFCIFKTHIQFIKVEQFWSPLNYEPVEIQEAWGHSSGIWILSCVENTTITILDNMHKAITFLIQRKEHFYLCISYLELMHKSSGFL